MGASNRLDGLRRALARLGSQVRIRALDAPLVASARAPVSPEVATHTMAPLRRGSVAVAAVAGASAVARAAGPDAEAVTVRGHATTPAARARGGAIDPVRRAVAQAVRVLPREARVRVCGAVASPPPPRAAALPVPPTARRGFTRRAAVMRRAPLAWDRVERDRLRAAWEAVRVAHAQDAADLELVGIYGPVPVSALAGAAVGDDRVAHLAFGSHRGTPVVGDLAFARHRGEGRLVSAVVAGSRDLNKG